VNDEDRAELRRRFSGPTDPYLIPGTNCLRNKLGAIDIYTLHDSEAAHVGGRLYLLTLKPPTGDLEQNHVRAIHRSLFAGVYDWAGKYRDISISKDGTDFARPIDIAPTLKRICSRRFFDLQNTQHDRTAFITNLTRFFNDVNRIHPFREGNGRTQEFYFSLVVERFGRALDWARVDKEQIDSASIAGTKGKTEQLRDIFESAVQETSRKIPFARTIARPQVEIER